jgi:hypothetical protein
MPEGWPEPVFDDEHDARAAEQRLYEQRAEVNRRFPVCCAKAREVEAVFGTGVRIVWAIEDGWMVGPVPVEEIERYEAATGPLRRMRLRGPGDPGDA